MSSENSLVVGVLESKGWELPGAAGASRLRPGDVIVRIGPEDAKDSLPWPFPGGVQVGVVSPNILVVTPFGAVLLEIRHGKFIQVLNAGSFSPVILQGSADAQQGILG